MAMPWAAGKQSRRANSLGCSSALEASNVRNVSKRLVKSSWLKLGHRMGFLSKGVFNGKNFLYLSVGSLHGATSLEHSS